MRDTRRPERPVTPLIDDHVELERRIREVSSALDGADFPSFDAVWCDLEDFALSHLAAEEEELIPRFVLHDPEEAATLLAQHRQIRDGLLEVGVAEQLHAIRKEPCAARGLSGTTRPERRPRAGSESVRPCEQSRAPRYSFFTPGGSGDASSWPVDPAIRIR